MSCLHDAKHLRPAIGPESGILCGLCGQDVPTALVLGALCREIDTLRQQNEQLEQAVCRYTDAGQCVDCRTIIPREHLFRGLRQPDKHTLCPDCLTRWFDEEDGDIEAMHVPYLAAYFLTMDISMSHEKHARLALMAHQAFPTLAGEIRKRMR
jgi:hypothetical protein